MRAPRWNWQATVLLMLAMVLATGAWIFYRLESWPQRTAARVKQAFAELAQFQPKVSVREQVIFEQTAPVLELVVVSRETQVDREMEHEWLGSHKRIRVRGTYRVRAGFDLTQPFTVRIQDGRVQAQVPPPKILSVDTGDVGVTVFENGYWNKISPSELEIELRALPELARQKAVQSGLLEEALKTFSSQLKAKLAPEYEVELSVAEPKG